MSKPVSLGVQHMHLNKIKAFVITFYTKQVLFIEFISKVLERLLITKFIDDKIRFFYKF